MKRLALLFALTLFVLPALAAEDFTGKWSGQFSGVTPDGKRLKLEIADRGVGIPAAEMPRVFDKFYRGRSVKAGGSGLGLAIVKRIVDENDGIVTIASAPGEGTTITLLLRVDK